MGSRLTRVTFRFAEPLQSRSLRHREGRRRHRPGHRHSDRDRVASPSRSCRPSRRRHPDPSPRREPSTVAERSVVTSVEPVPSPSSKLAEPIAVAEEIPLPRAKSVRAHRARRRPTATSKCASPATAQLKYKAFRLESPSRLVIDLEA